MIEMLVFSAVAVVLLLALVRLAWKPAAPPPVAPSANKLPIEELFPLHCRHFPQVRQALSVHDRQYLKERASRRIQRQSLAERRRVVREFLAALKEDFLRLDRLGRTVAALSPRVSRKQEFERLRLGLRFWALYGLVRLRLGMGTVSVPQLARLTELIGSLAAQIEAAMAALEEGPMPQVRPGVSA